MKNEAHDTRVFEATFRLRGGQMIHHTGSLAEIEALFLIHKLRLKELRMKEIGRDGGHEK